MQPGDDKVVIEGVMRGDNDQRFWSADVETRRTRGYPLVLDAERLGSHDRWAAKLRLDVVGEATKDLGYLEDFPVVHMASPFRTLEDAIEYAIEYAHRLGYQVTIFNKSTTP